MDERKANRVSSLVHADKSDEEQDPQGKDQDCILNERGDVINRLRHVESRLERPKQGLRGLINCPDDGKT